MDRQEILSAEYATFIDRLLRCETFPQSFDVLLAELQAFGLLHAVYGIGMGKEGHFPVTFGTLSNHPPEFLALYAQDNLFLYDDEVLWGTNESSTLIWGENVPEKYITEEARKMERIQARFGIQHGLTIPFCSPQPCVFSGIGLSATHMNREDFGKIVLPNKERIEVMCQIFSRVTEHQDKYHALSGPGPLQFPQFTDSELEVLRLIAEGHELKHIAEMRQSGVDNINIFSRHIRQKLKADNLPQAIYKATALRII